MRGAPSPGTLFLLSLPCPPTRRLSEPILSGFYGDFITQVTDSIIAMATELTSGASPLTRSQEAGLKVPPGSSWLVPLATSPQLNVLSTSSCGGKGLVMNNKTLSHHYSEEVSAAEGWRPNIITQDVPMALILGIPGFWRAVNQEPWVTTNYLRGMCPGHLNDQIDFL